MYLKVLSAPGLHCKLGTEKRPRQEVSKAGSIPSLPTPRSEEGYFTLCWEKEYALKLCIVHLYTGLD